MNQFFDKNLDNIGANKLDSIISDHRSNIISDREAINRIDRLRKSYPKSPQLLISKAIFSKNLSKYHIIDYRIPLCKKAINLDSGFFDGYRRLSQSIIANAWALNQPYSSDYRMQLMTKLSSLINLLKRDDKSKLINFLWENPDLFDEDYKEKFKRAILKFEEGLEKIDQNRYPKSVLKNFNEEYDDLLQSSKNEVKMKFLIFHMARRMM